MGSLEVDSGGMRAGAHDSDALAASLASGTPLAFSADGSASSAGIAAMEAASSSATTRQARRIGSYSGRLTAGGDAYERDDGAAASDLTVIV